MNSLFVLSVNVTYFVDQNTNNQCGIFKTLWPHASGISAVRSIVVFSFIDSPVVTPWGMTMLSKKNLIQSLVVKYPYHRGYLKLQ